MIRPASTVEIDSTFGVAAGGKKGRNLPPTVREMYHESQAQVTATRKWRELRCLAGILGGLVLVVGDVLLKGPADDFRHGLTVLLGRLLGSLP